MTDLGSINPVWTAPRDGAAVLAMQERHDRVGGSAPHLDIRSI